MTQLKFIQNPQSLYANAVVICIGDNHLNAYMEQEYVSYNLVKKRQFILLL